MMRFLPVNRVFFEGVQDFRISGVAGFQELQEFGSSGVREFGNSEWC
jgi:hypothetical protein